MSTFEDRADDLLLKGARATSRPRWAGDSGEVWPDIKPLPDELLGVPAFPLDALPDSLRPLVADVSSRMNCPADFVAVPMLVAAASLVARRVAVRPQARTDWTERPNLWALIVGRPGAMKSPAISMSLAPIERMERAARADNAERMKAFDIEKAVAKMRKEAAESSAKAALKRNPGADVSSLISDSFDDPEQPPRTRYVVNDTTYEQLGVILSENPGGVLAVRDEMKAMLADLSKEEKSAQRGFFLQAWSGGSYTFDRVMRGHIHIEDARLSMIGGIQPGPLSELVNASRSLTSNADGLLDRFLIAWPDDPAEWTERDEKPDYEALRLALDAFDELDRLTPASVGAEQDVNRVGEAYGPHYLRFDEPARKLFVRYRNGLEERIRHPDNEGLESAFSKFRHHTPALALTVHLLDGNQGPVGEISMLRALTLADYFEAHARRCYASSRRSTVRAAKAILRRLEAGSLQEPFTVREIHKKDWSGLSDPRIVADAVYMLASHGWLIDSPVETGGRRKTVYCRNKRASA